MTVNRVLVEEIAYIDGSEAANVIDSDGVADYVYSVSEFEGTGSYRMVSAHCDRYHHDFLVEADGAYCTLTVYRIVPLANRRDIDVTLCDGWVELSYMPRHKCRYVLNGMGDRGCPDFGRTHL